MRYVSFDFSNAAAISASVDRDLVLERVGRHRHDLELHLLVALAELGGDVGVAHRHPAGERVAQLLDLQRAAQARLELRGGHRRILELQHLPIALLADELAVLLEAGQRQDALANLDVADGDALLARLGDHRFFVDELLQDLPIDAELLDQLIVDLPAVGVAIGVAPARCSAA